MLSSEMWRCVDLTLTDVSEERRLTQDLYSATYQKTTFFIVTAVKASNLTYSELLSGFPFIVQVNPDNNLESLCITKQRSNNKDVVSYKRSSWFSAFVPRFGFLDWPIERKFLIVAELF
jgi:hypothetical protein